MEKLLSKPTMITAAAKPPILHVCVIAVAKEIVTNVEHRGLKWH